MKVDRASEDHFWELAEPMLAAGDAEEGTIMSSTCLRSGGEFLAMPNHRGVGMVVKLPRERVAELIADGVGEPFAPAKRVFKEWVLIPTEDDDLWLELLAEGKAFVNP